MKYNEGDKVRIKSKEWYNNNKDEYGNVHLTNKYGWMFTERDSRFCGKVVTILSKGTTSYAIIEDGCEGFWTDEMIECKVEEEVSYDTESEWLKHEIALPDGYIFKDENGNVINAKKIVLEKKKEEYPKTFEECVHVLEGENRMSLELMNTFRKLIDARNAYWKIAGEKMGLDKPWKPDWEDEHQEKYIIGSWLGTIQALEENFVSHPLAFSTEEMRDAFKKNFDLDIEFCKEFL